jgi:hypothetical protein
VKSEKQYSPKTNQLQTFVPFLIFQERDDVALVSQLTVDRLSNLRRLCDHWTGHMSVAVYILSEADVEEVHKLRKSSTKVRNNVDFHLTFAEEVYIIHLFFS